MLFNIDAELGVSAQALLLHARRTQVLAANIANADTPNYKARDIDFRAELARAAAHAPSLGLEASRAGHFSGAVATDGAPDLMYRVPLAPSLDGNTVDAQLEQAAFAENTVRYQGSLMFVSGAFRDLMLAITGQ